MVSGDPDATSWDALLALEPADGSWENWRNPVKGKESYKNQLSRISIRGAW